MKFLTFFILIFVVFFVFVSIPVSSFRYYYGHQIVEDKILDNLNDIANSKAHQVEDFLDAKKADAIFLSEMEDTKNIFGKELTYIDEYGRSIKLESDLDFKLRNFQESKGYSDLIFINNKGDVIWTAERHNELGTNLVTGAYKNSLLAQVYEGTRKDLGVGVTDPDYYEASGNVVSFITSPIFEENKITGKREFLGVIALKLNVDELQGKFMHGHDYNDSFDVYIVNRDFNYITSIKYGKNIKKGMNDYYPISSEGIIHCFNNYHNYYLERQGYELIKNRELEVYENYIGMKVLGGNQYILESGWCIIVESNVSSLFEDFFLENEIIFWISLVFFVVLLVAGFFLDYFYFIEGSEKL